MKKLSKMTKTIFTLMIAVIITITSVINTNAASETIQLGQAYKTQSYIAGVSFSYKVTTDGKYLYCLNIHKETAQNVQATLVKNSSYINGGVVYILKNGYPNKSITGDKDKDYYITQTALWWYLDKTTGSTNLGEQFKQDGSDPHGLRQHVINLVNEGYNHRNDNIETKELKLAIDAVGGKSMTLSNNYYVSNEIKATAIQNLNSYNVTLENAPAGTVIEKAGQAINYTGAFNVKANETFRVKVPAASINATASIKVVAKAKGVTRYTAFEYKPADNNMQHVALFEKEEKEVSSNITLDISTSKVSILKVDANTKQPLAGAKFVLKDANGKEITSWTSTNSAHIIRNLANGNYTIEEVEAPIGYVLNKNVTKFAVTDTNRDIKITVENTAKKVVVNIIKIDQATRAPLAGAILVVKKADGTEIARFTTTNEPYVLTDLANGTYTVEEVSAPAGYILNTEKITFTVDENHLSHQISFVNAKETPVPDTASASSLIMIMLGLGILGFGIKYITKNAKRI